MARKKAVIKAPPGVTFVSKSRRTVSSEGKLIYPDAGGRVQVAGSSFEAYVGSTMGQTDAQTKALVRLHPYTVLDMHDDGDMTVKSGGDLWVVTLDGKMFKEMKPSAYRKERRMAEQAPRAAGSLFDMYAHREVANG